MSEALRAKKRALKSHVIALANAAWRFEVDRPRGSRPGIRSLAKRLAEDGEDASALRAASRTLSGEPRKGAASSPPLRRSPLVGADLDLAREVTHGRKLDL